GSLKLVKGDIDDGASKKESLVFKPEEGDWPTDGKLPALAADAKGKVTITAANAVAYPDGELFEKEDPLAINLTALNTFILICSSVTMILALSAIERGDQAKLKLFLFLTILIG